MQQQSIEKRRFFHSLVFPGFFIFLMWTVKLIEHLEGISFYRYGVRPMRLEGIPGILFSPFIHGDWEHLYANTISFSVLGVALFYFYNKISYKVFFLIFLLNGCWLWLGARDSWHIGASGLIYGMAAFLFFSGVFRRFLPLAAISLLVVFFYGGMIWGIFPLKVDLPYSWESHLWGGLAGFILSIVYRREGPVKPKKFFELEEEIEVEEGEIPYWEQTDIKDP